MGKCLSVFTEQHARFPAVEGVKVFTMAELQKATKYFGVEITAESSDLGSLLRGHINPKTLSPTKRGVVITVAVQGRYLPTEEALQEWLVALEFLRRNSHPALVKLIGYRWERSRLFFVTEYFPNGSLRRYIYRDSRQKSLSWEARLKISIGVADCVAFLHARINTGLQYLTPSKIMLDTEFNARISYFGLDTYYVGTHVPFSEPDQFPYFPPEYTLSGQTDMAGDVYSFGVILLVILTGFGTSQLIPAVQAIRCNEDNIAEMIDPSLEGSYPLEAGRRMYELIKQCIEKDLKKRPSMQQVMDNLNVIAHI